jgi:hypothetical protein
MPNFTLHRNYVMRTTHGHTISFEKGKATHVPPICVPDAIAIGAIPEDAKITALGEETPEAVPLNTDQRKAAIFAAFTTMSSRTERSDFTASGVPNAKRMFPLTGFEVTTTERDARWVEYKAKLQADKDQDTLDARVAMEA